MPDQDRISPISTLSIFGQSVPLFALTFDKRGNCTSPLTRDALIARIAAESFTDILLYCHGWNTDWSHAIERYNEFFRGVGEMAASHPEVLRPGFKPVLVGISWPSAALVWPSEATPDLLAAGDDFDDADILAEDMAPADAEAFRALVARGDMLDRRRLDELATLLAPSFETVDEDETPGESVSDAEALNSMFRGADLVRASTGSSPQDGISEVGTIDDGEEEDLEAAGAADLFGLRTVLRLATVLKMKDRAGAVGRAGVAETLFRFMSETQARLHLVGHSYGCKVLMTALCAMPATRNVESALLLQPAVNHLAFSAEVQGRSGGFRKALKRVEKPILVTHSRRDFPLRHVFHLAVRRRRDLGEIEILAGAGKWSAMGGYGPGNIGTHEKRDFDMSEPGGVYPLAGEHNFLNIAAHDQIRGHSDVTNKYTFWAGLQNLN